MATKNNSPNRDAIRQEYIETNISLADLAAEHNIRITTIKNWARRENWSEQKRQVESKATLKRIQKAADTRVGFTEKLDGVADDSVARLKAIIAECKSAYEIEKAIAALERLYKIKGLDAASQLAFRQAEGTAGTAETSGDGFIRALRDSGGRSWQIRDVPENAEDTIDEADI